MKPLLITIYVPLCGEHCTFCNRLTTPSTMRMVTDYTHALLTEIASAAELCEGYSVETIRFTGGTPLLLGGTNLATIVFALKKHFCVSPEVEITLETVTDKIDEHNFRLFERMGVTALEFFVPTLVSAEHAALEAPGTLGHLSAHNAMRKFYGPETLGLHLLYGFAGQTAQTWQRTLDKACSYDPAYVRLEQVANMPDAEADALAKQAATTLAAAGLTEQDKTGQLFAKPGKMPHWVTLAQTGADQLGLGAGMVSKVDELVYRTTGDVARYVADVADPSRVIVEVGQAPSLY